jgi:hypothetical protein
MLRDLQLAHRARSHGAHYSLRIIREARRAGIPISLGFALIDQETGGEFKNLWGHDSTIFIGGHDRKNGKRYSRVTRGSYKEYKRQRGTTKMQGVGPAQLTWWEFQDAADRRGGCWKPRHNIAIGFQLLADLIRKHGTTHAGVAAYNGSGAAAQSYADEVLRKRNNWHKRLT